MSMDERSLDVPIPDRARPLTALRWFNGVLQQAWAPIYGGAVEWRDVPSIVTDGVSTVVRTTGAVRVCPVRDAACVEVPAVQQCTDCPERRTRGVPEVRRG